VWWKTPPLPLIEDDEVIQEQPSQSGLTERYVEKSVSFIRENADRPWFLYLAHMHVHLPLYAGERFMKESKNGDYGACVAEIDWSLAVLLHELERLGLEEDTLIIFTSDNGARGDHGGSNLPLRGGKFSSYEGGQRIALIAYWKGRIEGGRLCDGIVSHIDFLPTFADLLGYNLEGKKPIDGVSIKDVLFDSTPSTRDEFVYWGFDMKNNAYLNAIRVGRWKLHRGKWDPAGNQQTIELYDLETDEAESKECSADHPETVTELQYRLSRWEEELGNAYTNTIGREPRPSGFAANPVTLTTYDENHPYIIAMYDKGDRG
jgi:arylsulfatase A